MIGVGGSGGKRAVSVRGEMAQGGPTSKKLKVPKHYLVTVDSKHREFVGEFAADEKYVIPALQAEKTAIVREMREMVGKEMAVADIAARRARLGALTEEIARLRKKKNDYYLTHAECLHRYFEEKKNISGDANASEDPPAAKEGGGEGNEKEGGGGGGGGSGKRKRESEGKKHKSVIDMFWGAASTEDKGGGGCAYRLGAKRQPASPALLEPPKRFHPATPEKRKREDAVDTKEKVGYAQRYLSRVDDNFFDTDMFVRACDVCVVCGKGEMMCVDDEGVAMCSQCGASVPVLADADRPAHRDAPGGDGGSSTYKRSNHFKEVITQFQGKQTTTIKPEIYAKIAMQFKKERIRVPDDVTRDRTRDVLKIIRHPKLYDHVTLIMAKFGVPPPTFSAELEDSLMSLFMSVQAPYAKFHPQDRFHFLNYHYVLYKFLELLGQTQYLPMITLLKRDIIIKLDETWKLICEELQWPFTPTV